MHLKSLELRNFRCYDNLKIDFDPGMTVLVGLNGRGKSAILDGIELALGALDTDQIIDVDPKDVRNMPVRENKRIVKMKTCLPVMMTADFGNVKIYRFLRTKYGQTQTTITGHLTEEPLQIFAYYDTGRMNKEALLFMEPYENVKKEFPVVCSAVNELLRFYNEARLGYNDVLKEFVIFDEKDGEQLASVASDGARSVVGMIADLALQMARACPEKGLDVYKTMGGIVLIDEVELHLHPSWQQNILMDLRHIFPKVQFIVSTHSALILSTVDSKCIRILDDNEEKIIQPEFSLGAEFRQILEDIQHVEQRPRHVPIVKDLNRYLQLIAEDKYDTEEALKLREKLDKWAGGNDPALVRADMDIRLRRMRSKK